MCRLYGFRSNHPTRVKCSLMLSQNALMAQSQADRRGHPNADGWGVACYEDSLPWLEKRDLAAHRDESYGEAVERIYARTVVAHVRHATVGVHSASNSHPFVYDCWSFAHNGTLRGLDRLEPYLWEEVDEDLRIQRLGQTDSELIFLWLLSRMRRLDHDAVVPRPAFDDMLEFLFDALQELDQRSRAAGARRVSRLNFILTDGQVMFATRFRNSLYIQRQAGSRSCDICQRNHTHGIDYPDYYCVTVASEPVNNRQWRPLPERSVTGISGDMEVRHRVA